ncbi:MAG TPA: thioredoxin [bacterium]|nr:thioredoxin [bacterium]
MKMNEIKYKYDVNSDEFDEKVIAASMERVIVVDFWAEWCGPCKMLGPILENVVKSFNGKVLLAKVDVDANQELALLYGIQSIPAVKVFKSGKLAEEFVGVMSEQEVKRIITSVAGDEIDEIVDHADKLLKEDRQKEAEKLYKSVIERNKDHPGALIGLAKIAIKNDDLERAKELLNTVDESVEQYNEARSLLAIINFSKVCNKAGGLEKSRESVEKTPGNLDLLYNLGCCYAVSSLYKEAFETFFSIIERNKDFGNGKAKDAILFLFNIVGQKSELTAENRGRLARILF